MRSPKLLWRSLFHRTAIEQELDEELRYHLERQIDDLVSKGMHPGEARYAALRQLGGIERRKEECRDAWGTRLLEEWSQDIRHAFRSLRKNPAFAAVAVLTLALGIGVNTTIFTMLDLILFRPLPYSQPDRLVRVFRTSPQSNSWPHSAPNFLEYRDRNDAFSGLAAFNWALFNLSDPSGSADRVSGMKVSPDFFPIMGTKPELGRVFTDADIAPGLTNVVVLSHRAWMTRFGGDPRVLGRVLRINAGDATIIGVMPDSFENALFFGPTDMWAPLALTDQQKQNRGNNFLNLVARLKDGVSASQAEAKMGALAAALKKEHGDRNIRDGIRIESFKSSVTQPTLRAGSWFLLGMTGFVLLIACVNLANLQLGRTTGRLREFALRAALGSGRRRLIQQSVTESLLLSLIGGALALTASAITSQLIYRRVFTEMPGAHLPLDLRLLAFGVFCSVMAAVLFGILPAMLAARADVNGLVKDNPRNSTGSRSHRRLRQSLIIVEVAFALVLLASAGIFVRGLRQVTHVETGWQVDHVLAGRIGLDGPAYGKPPQRIQFLENLRDKLAALPGVENAAISWSSPTWLFNSNSSIVVGEIEGPTITMNSETVSPQYFETLSIPLREGRTFTADDRFTTKRVTIVNESMARKYWPNESALGKRLMFAGDTEMHWWEIVGVVGDVRFPSAFVTPDTDLTMYMPMAQHAIGEGSVLVRTAGSPDALIPAVRQAVAELDKDQAISGLASARQLIHQNLGGLDLAGMLLTIFSAVGVVLAAIGIVGVISYTVAQRTNEIGIRIALGAARREVRWLILKQALTVTLVGTSIGIVGTVATSRMLATAIPQLPAGDAVTLVGLTALLFTVAMLASYVPARRASKVDPMIALRHE